MEITKITLTGEKIISKEKSFETERIEKEIEKSDFDARYMFHREILTYLSDDEIEDYAETHLDMMREYEAEEQYGNPVDSFQDSELIRELKSRGYEVLKCQTLSDSMKLEYFKKNNEVMKNDEIYVGTIINT